jgi:hypothetical protein
MRVATWLLCFLPRLSSILGLRHEALVSAQYDAQGNIIVDVAALRAAITAALA